MKLAEKYKSWNQTLNLGVVIERNFWGMFHTESEAGQNLTHDCFGTETESHVYDIHVTRSV